MIGVKTRMALFFAVVLGIAGLCVLAVSHKPTEERGTHGRLPFERAVAEGLRLWNPKTGADSFRFDACRIEKMKMGAFTLGWFDVLCLDGLVLNLPLDAEDSGVKSEECKVKSGVGKRSPDRFGVGEVFARMLPQSLFGSAGVSSRNFAGIEIKGLQVNKVEDRREVPVFAADGAKNYRQTLKLRNCRVFEPGRTNSVGVAYIVLQPAPALVWKDGMRRLDDLLPNFSGGETPPLRGEVSLRGGAVSAAQNDFANTKGKEK